MKLTEVFPESKAGMELLRNKANAFDNPAHFRIALRELSIGPDQAFLSEAVKELSLKLDQKSQTGVDPHADAGSDLKPVVFSGQQAYVDYSPGVAARMDILDSLVDHCLCFFGFVDYDNFGSDSLISQIKIPTPYRGTTDFLLRIRLYPNFRNQKQKDMRFVSAPTQDMLNDAFNNLSNAIVYSLSFLKRQIPPAIKKEALERLEGLHQDLEYARLHSRSAAEFNMIWSVRMFRRMGYNILFCGISELMGHENLVGSMAVTLGQTIRENRLLVESINEIVREAGDCDLCFRPVEDGYIPIFMTDKKSGVRFPLRYKKKGPDYQLFSTGDHDFKADIGTAGNDEVREFLSSHKGLWSPNIFSPVYLYRCGLQGFISGKSSIRYSVVLGHVMERLFQEKPPPNLHCSIPPSPQGILHSAVYASQGSLPESLMDFEPTLVYRMIFAAAKEVREEILALRKQEMDR